jgi:hypothetical protein
MLVIFSTRLVAFYDGSMHASRAVASQGEIRVSAVVLREQISLHSKRTAPRTIGLGLSGLAVAFSAADAAGKLLAAVVMIANTPPIGLPAN